MNIDLIYQDKFKFDYEKKLFEKYKNRIESLKEKRILNNFKEAQVIPPSKKVANLSIRQLPQTQLNYVTQIEQTEISLKTSKKFIRTIKNDMYPDIYGVKKEKFAEFYSREEIQKMIEKHNGS